MYAMTGIIKGNTVLTNDNSIEKYNGRKVIITVLDDEKQFDTVSDEKQFDTVSDEKQFDTVSDEKLFTMSDSLINQNMDAYQELAK